MNFKIINYITIGFIVVILILIFFVFRDFIGQKDESFQKDDLNESFQKDDLNESFSWQEQRAFVLDVVQYNTSEEIMNYINSEYELFERNDGKVLSPIEVYYSKKGTEADLLRLTFEILSLKKYNGVLLVYEFDGGNKFILNFRDNDLPKYYYFDGGEMKIGISGWSFKDLISAESKREKVIISRYGIFNVLDLRSNEILNLEDVEEWI